MGEGMRDTMTDLERQCWTLSRHGYDEAEIAARLDVSRDWARHGLYGAASVAIRRWQRRRSRGFLRRLLGKGRAS